MQPFHLSRTLCTLLVLLLQFSSIAFSTSQDVTKRVDFKQVGSTVRLEYKLLSNLPAKLNSEFIIQAKTRATPNEPAVDLEVKATIDIVAKLQTPQNIIPLIVPDNIPLTTTTPYTVEGPKGLLVVARASDVENGYIKTKIPVKAFDYKGTLLTNINTKNDVYFSDPSTENDEFTQNRAPFINGIATVPLRIKPANSSRSDVITRVLLNKLRVSSQPTQDPRIAVKPQAIATPLELRVLPENYSGIYSSEVAKKSPSAGAKGVGFWQGVGEWFAWKNIST